MQYAVGIGEKQLAVIVEARRMKAFQLLTVKDNAVKRVGNSRFSRVVARHSAAEWIQYSWHSPV